MTPEQTLQVKSLKDRADVFNYVVDHLRLQGKQSRGAHGGSGGICAYRGDEGAMCAVGALITDDEYDREWEGCGVVRLLDRVRVELPSSLRERLSPHVAMLMDLQRFHDSVLGLPNAFEHGRFSERVEEILLDLREDWNIQ